MRRLRKVRSWLWMVPVSVAAAACAGAPPAAVGSGPNPRGLEGDYHIQTFVVQRGDSTIDLAAAGAVIHLLLSGGGRTSGTLAMPGGVLAQEAALTAPLDGNWTLAADSIALEHEANTVLEQMRYAIAGETLSGEAVLAGDTVRLVLKR